MLEGFKAGIVDLLRRVLPGERVNLEPAWKYGQPEYSPVTFETMARQGYRRNELIFACVTKRAKSAAEPTLRVYERNSTKVIPEHGLRRLIRQPNPFMTEFDFWSSTITLMDLAGVAYWEKERSQNGRVVALWPLRPDRMKPIPDRRDFLAGYEYDIGGEEPELIPAQDVLCFNTFDPLSLYQGWPPAAVAARVADIDNEVTDFVRLFFQNAAVPQGLLKTRQKLADTEAERLRRRWKEIYGGYRHWTDIAVLDSDAEYQAMGMEFDKMQFRELDARNEARICLVFDIPPILVGAKVGLDRATYSNYAEARLAWWYDSLSPLYIHLQDEIELGLAADFGGEIDVRFDFSLVRALAEAMAGRWAVASNGVTAGWVTVNEARVFAGLPRRERGDVWFWPLASNPSPAGGEKTLPPTPSERKSAQTESEGEENEPTAEHRRKWEPKVEKALLAFWQAEAARFIEWARPRAATWTKARERKADPGDEAFWEESEKAGCQLMLPFVEDASEVAALLAIEMLAEQYGIGVDWALVHADAAKWARGYTYDLVTGIDETTKKALQEQIAGWIEAGEDFDALVSRVSKVYSNPVRARMIAVTEATRAYAQGNVTAWRLSGVVTGKIWRTARDEKVCPYCGALSDQLIELDGEFEAAPQGLKPLKTPYPPAHVLCRCGLSPYVYAVEKR